MVERYVQRLLNGEIPPAISVDGNVLVDGNHRFVAGELAGKTPATKKGTLSASQRSKVKSIGETIVSPIDWGGN